MKVTVVCEGSKVTLTVPKKWERVSQVIDEFRRAKTARALGLGDDEALVVSKNGLVVDVAGGIRQLADGDVLKVAREVEELSPRGFVCAFGVAKQLTKKAEDFVAAKDADWRGVRFAWLAVCDGHGGQQAAASAKDTLLHHFLKAMDRLEKAGTGGPGRRRRRRRRDEERHPPGAADLQDDDLQDDDDDLARAAAALAKYAPLALKEAFEEVDRAVTSTAGTTATVSVAFSGDVAVASLSLAFAPPPEEDSSVDSDDERDDRLSPLCPPGELSFLEKKSELAELAESCAVVVTANVGDSLAVFVTPKDQVRYASHDHRLERNSAEQSRCRKAGGVVSREHAQEAVVGLGTTTTTEENDDDDDSRKKRPLRLWPGGLMMSRAIGDHDALQAIATPEVRCAFVSGRARLVVASDGLWDEVSPKHAAKLAGGQPTKAAKSLVDEAKKRGQRRNDADDVAVVVADVGGRAIFRKPPGNDKDKDKDDDQRDEDVILRTWDPATLEDGLLSSDGALREGILEARRRRVRKEVAKAFSGGDKKDEGRWLGLAADPASFFEPIRVVGVGAFGNVVLCEHRLTGEAVAVKVATKKAALKRKNTRVPPPPPLQERDALLAVGGGGGSSLVVSLLCSWQNERATYLATTTPYASNGDLARALTEGHTFKPASAAFYGGQLVRALAFVHARGVMHRDVKPENVLLATDGHAILADLGLASVGKERAITRCGSDTYRSPEMNEGDPYGTATDLWSAAVLVYELLAGATPFDVVVDVSSTDKDQAHLLKDKADGRDDDVDDLDEEKLEEEEESQGFVKKVGGKKKKKKKKKRTNATATTRPLTTTTTTPQQQQEPLVKQPLLVKQQVVLFSSSAFDSDSVDLLERCLDRDRKRRLGVAADGFSADVDAVCAHPWWRRAVEDGPPGVSPASDADWWAALETRRVPPPPLPRMASHDKDDDDAQRREARKAFVLPDHRPTFVENATGQTNASRRSAASYSSGDLSRSKNGAPPRPAESADGDKAEDQGEAPSPSFFDPYAGFDYGSPASVDCPPPRPTAPGESEGPLPSSSASALSERAILTTHAVARGFLARLEADDRRDAADVITQAARWRLVDVRLKRRLKALPRLRRAAVLFARAAERAAMRHWFRYSTRVASFLAAQERDRQRRRDDAQEKKKTTSREDDANPVSSSKKRDEEPKADDEDDQDQDDARRRKTKRRPRKNDAQKKGDEDLKPRPKKGEDEELKPRGPKKPERQPRLPREKNPKADEPEDKARPPQRKGDGRRPRGKKADTDDKPRARSSRGRGRGRGSGDDDAGEAAPKMKYAPRPTSAENKPPAPNEPSGSGGVATQSAEPKQKNGRQYVAVEASDDKQLRAASRGRGRGRGGRASFWRGRGRGEAKPEAA